MRRITIAVAVLVTLTAVQPRAASDGHHVPTMTQFMSAGFPLELVGAHKADRIAWIANDKGLRNVFTAAAPDFKPVRVTSYLKDDGVDTIRVWLAPRPGLGTSGIRCSSPRQARARARERQRTAKRENRSMRRGRMYLERHRRSRNHHRRSSG